MEPVILEEKIFKLLGCVFYGDPFHSAKEWSYENEIGMLWQRYMSLCGKYAQLLKKISENFNTGYEIHLEPEEFKDTKQYYVMIGMEVNDLEEIPLEMFIKIFPKSNYVVFTTRMEEKYEMGAYIYREWLPENSWKQSFPYIIQGYDGTRYKGLEDPKSEIDWYIPVKKVGEN